MAIRRIIHYPDPVLREDCKVIENTTDEIRDLLSDMAETMYDAPGIGLAAPQIGIPIRAIVVDVGSNKESGRESKLYKILNPEIVQSEGEVRGEEGCLSIPDVNEEVSRFETVVVKGLNENGDELLIEADGMLSICLQHEIDHLDGVLFTDYLKGVRKELVKSKLKKLTKLYKKTKA